MKNRLARAIVALIVCSGCVADVWAEYVLALVAVICGGAWLVLELADVWREGSR